MKKKFIFNHKREVIQIFSYILDAILSIFCSSHPSPPLLCSEKESYQMGCKFHSIMPLPRALIKFMSLTPHTILRNDSGYRSYLALFHRCKKIQTPRIKLPTTKSYNNIQLRRDRMCLISNILKQWHEMFLVKTFHYVPKVCVNQIHKHL